MIKKEQDLAFFFGTLLFQIDNRCVPDQKRFLCSRFEAIYFVVFGKICCYSRNSNNFALQFMDERRGFHFKVGKLNFGIKKERMLIN